MKDFQIFSDSSCDIDPDFLAETGVIRIPFYVSFDQQNYEREIEELSLARFYERLTTEKIFPKSSLPTIDDYMRHFENAIRNGQDVLCICITPKFSGSYQAAVTAQQILAEDYPEANILVLNSMQATGAQGLTVLEAVRMRDAGLSVREAYGKLMAVRETSRIIFTVGTLEYLQRGGRIGKAASLAGSFLHLQPLIELYGGELMPYGTVRGRKKALTRIVQITEEYFKENNLSYDDFRFGMITGFSAREETLVVKSSIEEMIGQKIDLPLFPVGVTIGTYTGPDPVGISFIRKYECL